MFQSTGMEIGAGFTNDSGITCTLPCWKNYAQKAMANKHMTCTFQTLVAALGFIIMAAQVELLIFAAKYPKHLSMVGWSIQLGKLVWVTLVAAMTLSECNCCMVTALSMTSSVCSKLELIPLIYRVCVWLKLCMRECNCMQNWHTMVFSTIQPWCNVMDVLSTDGKHSAMMAFFDCCAMPSKSLGMVLQLVLTDLTHYK